MPPPLDSMSETGWKLPGNENPTHQGVSRTKVLVGKVLNALGLEEVILSAGALSGRREYLVVTSYIQNSLAAAGWLPGVNKCIYN